MWCWDQKSAILAHRETWIAGMRILVSLCGLASITNIIKATSLQLMTMRSIRCWVPARWMRSFLSCDYIFPRSYIYIQTNEVLYQNEMCVNNGIWRCQCKVCGSASGNVRSIERWYRAKWGKIPTASPQDEVRRHTISITVRFYTILTHYRQ